MKSRVNAQVASNAIRAFLSVSESTTRVVLHSGYEVTNAVPLLCSCVLEEREGEGCILL